MQAAPPPPNCLMVGTGEYTTGFVGGGAADSDKGSGVVALVCLDLQRRGVLGRRLGLCGSDGRKLPALREHMRRRITDTYSNLDASGVETWPEDGVVDREAYKAALDAFEPGDVCIVFTPDDTHLPIVRAALARGLHVLVTKPPVKTLSEHREMAAAATAAGRLCAVELHKRFDPIYADAADRIQSLGSLSYFTSYMSQPVHQLQTFKRWAGISSDISYYLNRGHSHHVDFHVWVMRGRARPESVVALRSTGVAEKKLGGRAGVEDTITLAVRWRNRKQGEGVGGGEGAPGSFEGGTEGHATYTASWVAPKADVHSQQRWFFLGAGGEVSVDQAHRGYTATTHEAGMQSVNPLFWRNTPTDGKFAAQHCYGYKSFENFVCAAAALNAGEAESPQSFDVELATIGTTVATTAILEAGRRSLDRGGTEVALIYSDEFSAVPNNLR